MDEVQIEFLVKLQNTDLEIHKNANHEKTFISRVSQIEEQLKTLQDEVVSKKVELKDMRKKKMAAELEIEDIDSKIKRHEDEKYRIKSKDEFQALEKEIANLEKIKDKEEDSLLQSMEREEELSRLIPSLEQQLTEEKGTLTKEKGTLTVNLAKLEANGKELAQQRVNLSSQMNKVYYSHYEQLCKIKNGLAVVKVEDEVCAGCNVKVSPSLVSQMRRGKLVYCESCSRIIYLSKRDGN